MLRVGRMGRVIAGAKAGRMGRWEGWDERWRVRMAGGGVRER